MLAGMPSADRRRDPAIAELQARVVDLALVGLHDALVLADERFLRVELPSGDRALRSEPAIALEVDARVLEQGLVPRHLSLGLRELDLKRARVDLGQEVAAANELSLREEDLRQLTVHAGSHRDGAERRDGPEPGEIDSHGGGARGGRDDRYRGGARVARRRGGATTGCRRHHVGGDGQHRDGQHEEPDAPAPRRCAGGGIRATRIHASGDTGRGGNEPLRVRQES
jgi:hypothetical protein